jgi:hypothetical protein
MLPVKHLGIETGPVSEYRSVAPGDRKPNTLFIRVLRDRVLVPKYLLALHCLILTVIFTAAAGIVRVSPLDILSDGTRVGPRYPMDLALVGDGRCVFPNSDPMVQFLSNPLTYHVRYVVQ